MTTYRIGTRGSLLAVTQSTLMKNECERISGEKFELVLIKTQGDEITNKPLWQLDGKDFFTKELDEALLNEKVDCVIHSYKDLGSERPEGIELAAITERTFAHDILLVPLKNISLLKNWKGDFVVGTSSPRRIANLTKSLRDYLPYSPTIRCETLRGNVNSRIKKLNDGQYHGITLALAGIERLAHGEKSFLELRELLKDLNYFVLPQSVFPSAASQGALGIEIKSNRNDNGKLYSILHQLNHVKTVEEVSRERKTFKEFGGGCHLAVGIHVKKISDNHYLHISSGEVDGKRVEHNFIEGVSLPKIAKNKKLFVGLSTSSDPDIIYDKLIIKKPFGQQIDLTNKHVFVTSIYCHDTLKTSSPPEAVWTAGAKSARVTASQGIWVNGTADSLGTEDLKILRSSKALSIIHNNINSEWVVLTHEDSPSDIGSSIGCYERVTTQFDQNYENDLRAVGACYWTSYPQYKVFIDTFPFLKYAEHFCGIGKTWQAFKAANISVYPVAKMKDFYSIRESL